MFYFYHCNEGRVTVLYNSFVLNFIGVKDYQHGISNVKLHCVPGFSNQNIHDSHGYVSVCFLNLMVLQFKFEILEVGKLLRRHNAIFA